MTAAELVVSLFEGRENSSAIRLTQPSGKKAYVPYRDSSGKDIPLSKELVGKHLRGELALGSYPIDSENMVKWASVDFDGKIGKPLEDAVLVADALEKKGFITWLERSQSGRGIHLWLFFDAKVPAKAIRGILSECIPEFHYTDSDKKVTSFDRVFPNQDDTQGGYGNLCALPLNGPELVAKGNTAFIDKQGNPFPKQSELLKEIYDTRNAAALVARLYVTKKELVKEKKFLPVLNTVPGGTKLLAPQGCAWLRKAFKMGKDLSEPEWYAAICQFAQVEHGDVLAHRFSEPYPTYSFKETQKKFEHAREENKPMTCEFIWSKFGDCGKRCAHLGVTHPWELAKVPLNKLDDSNKGRIYTSADMGAAGMEMIKKIASGKRQGYAWGYNLLDDHTELRPRNLVIVAARQGMGKTAVMIDASVRCAQRNIPQYIFSIEMGYEELSLRYLARISGIDQTTLVTGRVGKQEFQLLEKAYEEFKQLPIYIDDSTREFDRMLDNAGELTYKNGQGIIWVDYLQLVRKRHGESKKEAVDRFVDGYKQMSKIIDSPVVALAQLNRGEEFAEGDDDLDSWLKDSGDIEQTADVIHYIRGQRGPGTIERRWRLHKERHRASGINFKFKLHQGIFMYEPEGYWNKKAVSDEDIFPKDIGVFSELG